MPTNAPPTCRRISPTTDAARRGRLPPVGTEVSRSHPSRPTRATRVAWSAYRRSRSVRLIMMVSSRRSVGPTASDRNDIIMADRITTHIGRCTHRGVVFAAQIGHGGVVRRRANARRRRTYGSDAIRKEPCPKGNAEDQIRPRPTASATASARPLTSSLSKIWVKCVVTVRGLMKSASAISGFDRPAATSRNTSASRAESRGPGSTGAGRAESWAMRASTRASNGAAPKGSPIAWTSVSRREASIGLVLGGAQPGERDQCQGPLEGAAQASASASAC